MPKSESSTILTICKGCGLAVAVLPELQGLISIDGGPHGNGKVTCLCGTIISVDVLSDNECDIKYLIPSAKGLMQ